jgi:hypothetical protein
MKIETLTKQKKVTEDKSKNTTISMDQITLSEIKSINTFTWNYSSLESPPLTVEKILFDKHIYRVVFYCDKFLLQQKMKKAKIPTPFFDTFRKYVPLKLLTKQGNVIRASIYQTKVNEMQCNFCATMKYIEIKPNH